MARKQKEYHYIYKTTCTVTGKYYIGMHSTDNLNDGYLGSGKRLWNSIKKHGKVNHSIEILEHYGSREDLRKREVELVNEDCIKDPMCMNLKHGGDGGLSGLSDSVIEKISKAGNDKLRELRKNDPIWSKKDFETRSKRMKEEFRLGIRKLDNFICDNTGFKHTDETKNYISVVMSEKQSGEKNSQYGTCWISKNEVKKKIKKDDLDKYIQDGWIKGFKQKQGLV